MRDAFAVLFFVSVGMLCDVRAIVSAPLLILITLAVVMIGKPVAAILVVRLSGRPLSLAVPVGAAYSQVGEFSFILGSAARELGMIDDAGWNALVAASIISIALNPAVYGLARKLSRSAAAPGATPDEPLPVDPKRTVLIGYGPVGRTVHRILTDFGREVTVIEQNLETVRRLRAEGQAAVYGDVLRGGILDEANIATAGSMILSIEVEDAAEVIRQARTVNPELRVLARCAHLRSVDALRAAGAMVVAGEAEVAVAIAEALVEANEEDNQPLTGLRTKIRDRLYDEA
jgi:CPA2 family monovalent cation:H+ antiporter-2